MSQEPAAAVEIRPLQGHAEYLACVALQKEIWGADFADSVPTSILMVAQKIGGIASGAFTPTGELVGFVFGISGIKNGTLVHWSDMLAVKPAWRNHGLGRRLKLHQREFLLRLGCETVYWTYDPLEARNANLNLNKLGAAVEEYVENMYATAAGILHAGLAMDRFVVAWPIRSAQVSNALAGRPPRLPRSAAGSAVVNAQLAPGGTVAPLDGPLPEEPMLRVEIPENIQQVKAEAPGLAQRWRAGTRRAFQFYMSRHYTVAYFYRDSRSGRCFYVLTRRDEMPRQSR